MALVLAAINLRPGITSLAPLIERIATELSLSRSFISLTTALPVLCMGLLAPLAPRLALRWGLERTIVLCLGLISLALLARLAAHQSAVLIGSAIALGAAIAVAGPLLSGFIKRYFSGQMGRVVGWYSLGMAIGGAGGAVLTAPATSLFGDAWHLGLAIWALPAALAVLLWLYLPNQVGSGEAQEGGLPWRQPRAWLISGFFALQAGLFYALATWVVARYHEAGLSLLRSNSLLSISMLMGLPSSFLLPWLAQRFDARYPLLLACGALSSLCLAMISFAPTLLPELWALLIGFGLGGSFALSLVLPLYEAGSPLAVSRWTAMMLFTGYCLACMTPILTGLARDLSGSYRLPFAVLTALALLMTLVAWLLGRSQRRSR
ncbi:MULTISPECIES: MFS transporter [Pseudomonadaceae]|jgi:CP family cyanate transporter-like MFS transporter|uniref:MFS transporter n=2 Tax=Ectopseudomonas TaxID=3236654 RepID=A0AA42QCK0_ECTOL|nr:MULTISPECIES: MFS transporter [Pseudomonas]ATH83236.1 MFS transporter [Pseudomonas mendocina]MBF8163521.1 MFS transporter [Pseudomonas mendocina]MDH0096267.1 MFS transporter [Pseudomonas sp. GD04158]MDH1340331.1 MFS transporter [Pseudomonas oleovorans]MDH1492027.1 MFS transporter [Pseudomonas oleovorans]